MGGAQPYLIDVEAGFELWRGGAGRSRRAQARQPERQAGVIAGSQSWPGQNLAPHQNLSETYTWRTASSPVRTRSKEIIQNSSGKTLQQARIGTVTVK